MGTRARGCISAGPPPGLPGGPGLTAGLPRVQGRAKGGSSRDPQVYALGLWVRPLAFSTNSKGYFGLCVVPISATAIQSMCTPKEGPWLGFRQRGSSVQGQVGGASPEGNRWFLGEEEPRGAQRRDLRAASSSCQTRWPRCLTAGRCLAATPGTAVLLRTPHFPRVAPSPSGRGCDAGWHEKSVSSARLWSLVWRFGRK